MRRTAAAAGPTEASVTPSGRSVLICASGAMREGYDARSRLVEKRRHDIDVKVRVDAQAFCCGPQLTATRTASSWAVSASALLPSDERAGRPISKAT